MKVTEDLKIANIYLSFLDNKLPVDEVVSIFISKQNKIRYHMGKKLTLKFIPQLRFYYDDSIEHAQYIDSLFQKLHKDD